MAEKTITIEITGDEAVIVPALDAFVKQYGWTEEIDGKPNPETKEVKARAILRQFMIEVIKAYNIKQAEKLAREQAGSQTDSALDLTVMTLEVR